MYDREDYIERINELAVDIMFSLDAGFPVNVMNEQELVYLVDSADELLDGFQPLSECGELRTLTMYFLDNGYDKAWNIGNLLVGMPIDK